jgi:hypothetical protein
MYMNKYELNCWLFVQRKKDNVYKIYLMFVENKATVRVGMLLGFVCLTAGYAVGVRVSDCWTR